MILLAGEWVPAWLAMSVTFLVASLGVAGLGWWVLRGDKRNRIAEEAAERASATASASASVSASESSEGGSHH